MNGGKSSTTTVIYIRQEIFDHLIYPLSIRLEENQIVQLFRKLHIMSSIDFKIKLEDWVEESTSIFTNLSEKESIILFKTCQCFISDFETQKLNSRYELNKTADTLDVRYFAIFFALHLFAQRPKVSNMDTRDKNPYTYSSPMSSPRGKGGSSFRSQSSSLMDYQILVNFIKSNIKLFLRLIASDIHNTEASLNAGEFNTLKLIFKTASNDSKSQFSSLAPFFVNFSNTTRINIDVITEWLTNLVYTGPTSTFNFNSVNLEQEDMVTLKNLSKCVTSKEGISNKILKITQCEDSYIYVNSSVSNLKISNCLNCTIIVAAVNKITSIDKCENCNICIASTFLRISNTIDSHIYSYTVNEPILFGDNRGIVLGPHNVTYDDLSNILKNSKVNIDASNFGNFSNPVDMHSKDTFSILQSDKFTLLITPFTNSEKNKNFLFMTPKEYSDVIIEREILFTKVQNMIKDANLNEEQEKNFHIAIQGYFREWMVNNGYIKSMTDVLRMIDVGMSTNN